MARVNTEASSDGLRRTVLVMMALNLGYFGVEFAVALAIGSVSTSATGQGEKNAPLPRHDRSTSTSGKSWRFLSLRQLNPQLRLRRPTSGTVKVGHKRKHRVIAEG